MISNDNLPLKRNEMCSGYVGSLLTRIDKIELKDNSDNLFTIENNEIIPSVPLSIDEPNNDNNPATKKYVDDNISSIDMTSLLSKSESEATYLKSIPDPLSIKRINIIDSSGNVNWNIREQSTGSYYNLVFSNYYSEQLLSFYHAKARTGSLLVSTWGKFAVGSSGGIKFNTSSNGTQNDSCYPQGYLRNLVPSTISSDELNYYTRDNMLDNVCPTYQFCENNYAKSSDIAGVKAIKIMDSVSYNYYNTSDYHFK